MTNLFSLSVSVTLANRPRSSILELDIAFHQRLAGIDMEAIKI